MQTYVVSQKMFISVMLSRLASMSLRGMIIAFSCN